MLVCWCGSLFATLTEQSLDQADMWCSSQNNFPQTLPGAKWTKTVATIAFFDVAASPEEPVVYDSLKNALWNHFSQKIFWSDSTYNPISDPSFDPTSHLRYDPASSQSQKSYSCSILSQRRSVLIFRLVKKKKIVPRMNKSTQDFSLNVNGELKKLNTDLSRQPSVPFDT